MGVKYILLNVNYDENETEKKEFQSLDSLKEEFEGDEELLGELLNKGVYEWEWWEWGEYHLINLGDYQ